MLTTIEKKKEYVQKLNIFDDTFFEMVAKDKDAVEDILRILLHDSELAVEQVITQSSIKNYFFKNSRGQNEKFHRLTNRVYDLKNNESEVNNMCELVEDYAKEYAKKILCELVNEGKLSAEQV